MAYSPIFGEIDYSTIRPIGSGGNRSSTTGGNIWGYKPIVPGLTSPKASLLAAEPLIGDVLSLAAQNTQRNLTGDLSDAVTNQIIDSLNARGVGGGVGGSPFINYAIADARSKAAQQLQNLGFEQAMALAPTVSKAYTNDPMDIFESSYLKALVDAAPDPAARANWEIAQFDKLFRSGAGNVGSPYSGVSVNYPGTGFGYTPPGSVRPTTPRSVPQMGPQMGTRPQSSTPIRDTSGLRPLANWGTPKDWGALPTVGDLYNLNVPEVAPFEQTVYTPPYAGPYDSSFYTPTTRTVTPANVAAPLEDPMFGFTYPSYIPPSSTRGVMPGASINSTLSPNRSVFTQPGNWGDLTGQDQAEYIDATLRYAGVNPEDFE